jgi:hypothetical protein
MTEEIAMQSVYTDADLLAVYKQRKKVLGVFWLVTLAYMAFCCVWWIYYMSLPYNHSMQNVCKWAVFIISPIYVISLFPLMGIKYSRVNRYFKALKGFSSGRKNVEKNYFYSFEKHNLQKDNIDVTYAVFESWNKKKQEWMEREAYCDPEKPLPDFGSGDFVQYVVQSNFIVQYRVLERGVLQFEEEYEDDEMQEEDTEENVDEIVEETAEE